MKTLPMNLIPVDDNYHLLLIVCIVISALLFGLVSSFIKYSLLKDTGPSKATGIDLLTILIITAITVIVSLALFENPITILVILFFSGMFGFFIRGIMKTHYYKLPKVWK